jgi:RHS repeat-associated protein
MADAAIERYIHDDATGAASAAHGNVILDFVDPDGEGQAAMELTARYLYGAAVDQILAKEDLAESLSDPERVLWHLADHLGTTRDLVDHEGTLVEHYEYDSFGNLVSGDTSLTRYLFTGREWDADIGLQYSRARWYDPSVGRWISEDPIGFAAGDMNLARYVFNSPINLVDPSGHEGEIHMSFTVNDNGRQRTMYSKRSANPWAMMRTGDYTISSAADTGNTSIEYPSNPYKLGRCLFGWPARAEFLKGLFTRENANRFHSTCGGRLLGVIRLPKPFTRGTPGVTFAERKATMATDALRPLASQPLQDFNAALDHGILGGIGDAKMRVVLAENLAGND